MEEIMKIEVKNLTKEFKKITILILLLKKTKFMD